MKIGSYISDFYPIISQIEWQTINFLNIPPIVLFRVAKTIDNHTIGKDCTLGIS